MTPSKYYGAAAIRGLNKIGDIYTPGDKDFPSFSQLGCVGHIDRILDYMPEKSRKELGLLLTLLSFFPHSFLRALIFLVEKFHWLPGGLGANIRLIRLGFKGTVMSLYYSNFKSRLYEGRLPHDVLGFSVKVSEIDP